MSIYAISDLHLSFSTDKPMEIFGGVWENYFQQIVDDWNAKVSDDDTVLLAGDLSWAMTLDNALIDIAEIAKLKGRKIIIRGNHDYWWQSYTKLYDILKEQNIYAVQNNALSFDGTVYCGTRGWMLPSSINTEEDLKIYKREIIRTELTLQAAKKIQKEGEPIVFMIHYPPFEKDCADTEFTELFEKYGVEKAVYGHLHGRQIKYPLHTQKNGIDYYLTSCDQLNNKLVKLY